MHSPVCTKVELHLVPSMRDYVGANSDGPSCSEEDKETKRMRSASTTPRSERDQVMGVTSVASRDSVRFGEGNDPETEDVPNEGDLDETPDNDMYHDADPGAGEIQGGNGSATLLECLGRLGAQTTSATCHSGESSRDTRSLPTDPSQVMSQTWVRPFLRIQCQRKIHHQRTPIINLKNPNAKKKVSQRLSLSMNNLMSKKNQSLRLQEMPKPLKPVNRHKGGPQTQAAKCTFKTLVEAHAKLHGSML